MLLVGVLLGWILRGDKSARDKIAINASWQEQIESQYAEQNRLSEQNKGLMEQISQYQVANKQSDERTSELSGALGEALALQGDLQQQLKEKEEALQLTTVQRDRLRDAVENRESQVANARNHLKQKDEKIVRLSRDLAGWHSRLPPLVEKFKERNQDAENLESELEVARGKIEQLEEMTMSLKVAIEPVSDEALPAGLDASNEPHDDLVADPETMADEPAPVEPEAPDSAPEFANDADDLKKIKGIGPAIEKKLNDLGVHRFDQIAEMSEYEIDRVAQHVKGFRSRIYREDWLGQARDLQYQKSNNPS
jgi:predicted flap endonuclease-1-like 5' DNA nuclease